MQKTPRKQPFSTRRWLVLLGFALLLAPLTSCIPPWQLIRQAVPRPYPPNAPFVILPISYRGLAINNMSRAEYMSRKNPNDRGKWRAIFTRMRHIFAGSMMNAAFNARLRKGYRRRKNELAIVPIAETIDTGFYGGLINRFSRVVIRVQVRVGRRVYDEFVVSHSTRPNDGLLPRFPTVMQRMQRDASFVGRYAGLYLRKRLLQE